MVLYPRRENSLFEVDYVDNEWDHVEGKFKEMAM
jgi:hypothetical protein